MVWWADTAVRGLDKLYQWLPSEIRQGARSWGELWDRIVERGREWWRATYLGMTLIGVGAWGWVAGAGQRLYEWYQASRGTLDEFRANPQGFILARLGPAWGPLSLFAATALVFYVNLWGQHARDLADFLGDPAGWIYNKLAAYLERIW